MHPDLSVALAYESSHVVEAGELTYSDRATLESCVAAAFAAGWRLDVLCARLDEWPWYQVQAERCERSVSRDGEWRLYVETAAEALAEIGLADQFRFREAR